MKYTPVDLSARILGLTFYFDENKATDVQSWPDDRLHRLVAQSFDCPLSVESGSISGAIDAGVFDPSWVADAANRLPSKITCIGHSLDGNQLSVDLAIDFPPVSLKSEVSDIDDLNERCDGWVTDLLDFVAMNEFGLETFGSYDEVGVDQKSIYLDRRT